MSLYNSLRTLTYGMEHARVCVCVCTWLHCPYALKNRQETRLPIIAGSMDDATLAIFLSIGLPGNVLSRKETAWDKWHLLKRPSSWKKNSFSWLREPASTCNSSHKISSLFAPTTKTMEKNMFGSWDNQLDNEMMFETVNAWYSQCSFTHRQLQATRLPWVTTATPATPCRHLAKEHQKVAATARQVLKSTIGTWIKSQQI